MTPKGKKEFKASNASINAKYGLLSTQWNKFVVDVMLERSEINSWILLSSIFTNILV